MPLLSVCAAHTVLVFFRGSFFVTLMIILILASVFTNLSGANITVTGGTHMGKGDIIAGSGGKMQYFLFYRGKYC